MTAPAPVWAVITGGGTAGHVLPGLCIAEELLRRGTPVEAVHWVGSVRGVETRLVPEAGFSLTSLPGRGLQRRLASANVLAVVGLLRAFAGSWGLLGRCRPAVVVGMGGYASLACGAAAVLRRVPLVVVEQNAVAGEANRALSRFAAGAASAFRGTDLRGARWIGNPVRSEVWATGGFHGDAEGAPGAAGRTRMRARRRAARAALGVESGRRMVAVFGGSLGARTINEAVAQAVSAEAAWGWSARGDLHVRHVSGRRNHVDARTRADARTGTPATGSRRSLAYDLVAYEEDMATLYAAADLVVCRAGATTVAELAAAGVPAVLVPLPGAPRDHQTANARAMVDAGAAVMVADAELDGARLVSSVDGLLADPARLESMARAGASVARPDAAGAAVDLVESCASRPRPSAVS